ncbi:MAG: sterol desaturase family protein [Myxococcota bacterium]|nr:sterol desaturase family protein [Myxococcota bacterium]
MTDWILDGSSLFVQGTLIPWVQTAVLYVAYLNLMPSYKGQLTVPFWLAFALNFVVVDYLYYWNHRLFHRRPFWPLHMIHHTMTDMDVLGTSRNTLWTSFFIVYVWVNSLMLFLLADPAPYLLSITLTASLDMWRHSKLYGERLGVLHRVLSMVLITPLHHAVHHSDSETAGNYGANLSLWDRLHGTYRAADETPTKLGVSTHLSLVRKLVWPF